MEETSQQEKPESEYINPNEEQGGIRRRLRDRDLLRKRKAEAEEKDQWVFGVESQRKRSRAEDKSGTKRRGRPRKTEPSPQLSVVQEEAAVTQESPAVVVVPEPAEVIPDQISASLAPLFAVESQSVSVLAAPDPVALAFPAAPVAPSAPVPVAPVAPAAPAAPPPVIESIPVFGLPLTSPAPVNLTLDVDPVSVQDSAPAPAPESVSVPAPSQDTVPAAAAAPPSAPPQVETLYTESQGREALDQVLIEDLGPDEEEDISTSQDKRADEDLSETLSTTINVPEQNKMYSIPTLASLQQEYLPGNQL